MLQPGPVRALGTMSGTSLDGVDAAMVETDGETIFGFGPTAYRAYLPGERAVLADALGKWPGEDLDEAEALVERAHLEVLGGIDDAGIVGFHGQTLAHDPRGRGTHQLGRGTRLAQALDLPVVWDFRSADIAQGGEGAPLAPFFHFACARWIEADAPLAFLNLGGVGNLTWVDPGCARPEDEGALLAFDTGPANAPIDDAVLARTGQPCDRDGALAGAGTVARDIVEAVLAGAWFRRAPPKSLDRDAFAALQGQVAHLEDADAVATLTAVAAASVARGVQACPVAPARLLVAGGGRHNPVMMRMLAESLACPVDPVEVAGLDGDMLEAQAFAHLAVRVARGLPTSCPGTTGVRRPVSGGIVSRPLEA
ncbi:anhydro-N-acetylmuramic acid kinase [Roseovarius sp. D22-M7]|uniref:anhydro-N-acetylmuramic acid kinase n=1 Tax=Roseovarius sp. D22-M7 TaxID=3127116 RepID=UPI00300FC722